MISEDMNLIVLGSEEENLVTISFLEDIPIKRTGIKFDRLVVHTMFSKWFCCWDLFLYICLWWFHIIQSYINHHRIFYYYLIVMFSKRKCKIRLHHILLLIDLIILWVSNTKHRLKKQVTFPLLLDFYHLAEREYPMNITINITYQ